MKMKLDKTGFTLIELLAVIVILGILMMTAIPAVTKAIAKSRRNTFWQNMKSYAKSAATPFLDGEYKSTQDSDDSCPYPGQGEFVIIPATKDVVDIEQGDIEKSSFKSPYVTSGNCQPTIIVANSGTDDKDELTWYVIGIDKAGNGIIKYTDINKLGLSDVKTGITEDGTTKCEATFAHTDTLTVGAEYTIGSKNFKYKDTCSN